MADEKMRKEHEEMAQRCADEVNAIALGDLFRNDDGDEVLRANLSEEELDSGDWYEVTMSEYIDNCLDAELRVNLRGEVRSAYVTVCTGGPHMVIDTRRGEVVCYGWFGADEGTAHLTAKACEEIEELCAEYLGL